MMKGIKLTGWVNYIVMAITGLWLAVNLPNKYIWLYFTYVVTIIVSYELLIRKWKFIDKKEKIKVYKIDEEIPINEFK